MWLKDLNQWQRKRAEAIHDEVVEEAPEVQRAIAALDAAEKALPPPQDAHAANISVRTGLELEKGGINARLESMRRERESLAWRALVEKTATDADVAAHFDEAEALERRLTLIETVLSGNRLRFDLERTHDAARRASGNLVAARRDLAAAREDVRVRMALAD